LYVFNLHLLNYLSKQRQHDRRCLQPPEPAAADHFRAAGQHRYAYTATGAKLRKTISTQKTTAGSVTDYCGNFLPNLISKLAIANLRFSAVNADG
jgi:hypothetical protein